MKTDLAGLLALSLIVLQSTVSISCSGRPGRETQPTVQAPAAADAGASKLIGLSKPEENASFRLKETVKVVLETKGSERLPDSVVIAFDGKTIATLKAAPWEHTIPSTATISTGRKSLKITAWKGGKPAQTLTRFIIFLSDVAPKKYGYKVVHTYPHDVEAFTQGLLYDKGVLFEGTGQKNGSCLREVELQTGKVVRQHDLDPNLFGEGIALYKDRLYQVTWENKVGYIYDKSTFNVINKIYYSTEGWGLTTCDDKLVMSDGTNTLAYYEPEMFTIVSRIEVYDNEKKVDALNELEFINREIWANIWQTDQIARIDPLSGKVLGYIDLKGLLPDADRTPETDVLNGIAWDADGKRIFVTGKKWPKLFEIRITE